MKNIKFLIPIIALFLFSCDDYLDINNDPNRFLTKDVVNSQILPAAQVAAYRAQVINSNQLGNIFMNGWGANVGSFGGAYVREYQLTLDNSFYPNIFQNYYIALANFQKIIDSPNSGHKNDYYIAAAKICKVHYMQYLVDLYGDIPFTEAFKGTANTTPKYNDDQFVYRKLLGELTDARALIATADPLAVNISAYDTMLQGDMAKWNQFANTIELRMLLRMSNSTGAVAAYRDSRIAALSNDFLTSDVTINPGYSSSADAKMNPLAFNYGSDVNGAATQNWTLICMTGHAYKALRSYTPSNNTAIDPAISTTILYPGVNDSRATFLYRGTLRGVPQGLPTIATNIPTTGTPARLGKGLFNPYNLVASPLTPGSGSTAFIPNFGGADGYVMTASESLLLQTEAGIRPNFSSLGLAGATQTNFDLAIEKSFDRLGITSTSPGDLGSYLTSINTKANFGYTASTTFNQKLHAIMFQKWVCLLGLHGIESFIEYNRTGYPITPLATTAQKTFKPKRLIYPTSEYVANSANVPNITDATCFTLGDPSLPFWQLGNPPLGN